MPSAPGRRTRRETVRVHVETGVSSTSRRVEEDLAGSRSTSVGVSVVSARRNGSDRRLDPAPAVVGTERRPPGRAGVLNRMDTARAPGTNSA